MNKRIRIVVLLLCVLLCLTACGKKAVKQTNSDGTVTKIEYQNAALFERAPYFELSGTALCMTFNGITWYEASIIDPDTEALISEGKLLAESSNISMYEADPDAAYEYSYVMSLSGTEEAFILFCTDDLPGEGYGTDFTTSIRYFTDGTETVPDLEYTILEDMQ